MPVLRYDTGYLMVGRTTCDDVTLHNCVVSLIYFYTMQAFSFNYNLLACYGILLYNYIVTVDML
jgi:hypothetical protein